MKKIVMFILTITMVISLCGCDIPKKNEQNAQDPYRYLYGVWTGSWEYEGVNIVAFIEFKENGEFYEEIYRDGVCSDIKRGPYETVGENIKCHWGKVTYTLFYYKDGTLTCGEHTFQYMPKFYHYFE